MKKHLLTTLSVSTLALSVSAALAQPPDQQDQQGQQVQQEQQDAQDRTVQTPDQTRAQGASLSDRIRENPDEFEGMEVYALEGDEIGNISEIVRETQSGDLFAVISSGGLLGIGADRAAVPLSRLEMQDDRLVYTSPNAMQELENSVYEEARFEDFQPEQEQQALAQGSNQQQNRNEGADQIGGSLTDRVLSAPDDFEGRPVYDSDGNQIGTTGTLVLKKENREFEVILAADEFLGLGDQDMVVPLTELELRGDDLVLSSTENAMPYVEEDFLVVQED